GAGGSPTEGPPRGGRGAGRAEHGLLGERWGGGGVIVPPVFPVVGGGAHGAHLGGDGGGVQLEARVEAVDGDGAVGAVEPLGERSRPHGPVGLPDHALAVLFQDDADVGEGALGDVADEVTAAAALEVLEDD